jgi:hypothetical protein
VSQSRLKLALLALTLPLASDLPPGLLLGAGQCRRTSFSSTADLASALRRAEAAHREHEKSGGRSHLFHRSGPDQDWSGWYAAYLVAEQAGTDLPG